MKKLFAALLFIIGVVVGLYVGVWVLFVGGILGFVSAVNQLIDGTGLDGMLIVWSTLKMMFASFVGYISGMIFIVPAVTILKK